MIFVDIIVIFYIAIFVIAIAGIVYFINVRIREKKKEKSILDRDDI